MTAGAFLDGINAASLSLMTVVTYQLGRAVLIDLARFDNFAAKTEEKRRRAYYAAWIIPSAGERGSNQMKDPGIRHLAVMVEDFDAAHQQLQKAGVTFLGEPFNNKGNRLVFFSDLDGNILHLIHRERPLP